MIHNFSYFLSHGYFWNQNMIVRQLQSGRSFIATRLLLILPEFRERVRSDRGRSKDYKQEQDTLDEITLWKADRWLVSTRRELPRVGQWKNKHAELSDVISSMCEYIVERFLKCFEIVRHGNAIYVIDKLRDSNKKTGFHEPRRFYLFSAI